MCGSGDPDHFEGIASEIPELTFEKAWQHLERTNAYDHVGARRKEWERVALKGGELTLATWRNYQSSFELKWARAEGISEREAEDKILRDLPFEWRERLTKECARKAQDNFWARYQVNSLSSRRVPGKFKYWRAESVDSK